MMSKELTSVVEESARGGFNLITGAVTAAITYAVFAIIMARLLGPEQYGFYALAIVMPQMLYYFTDFGISNGLIKFSTDLRLKDNFFFLKKLIKYSVLFRFLAGLLIFLIAFFLADFFAIYIFARPELIFYIKLSSISILFQALFNTITSTYIGLDKTELSAIITNIEAISKASISIVLVIAGFGVTGAIIGHVVGFIVGSAIGGIFLFITVSHFPNKKSESVPFSSTYKKMFKYGLPLYFSLLLVGFLPPLENLILAFFTSDADIGNFKATVNFITVLNMVTLQITSALLPAFSKMNSFADRKIQYFFKSVNKFVTFLIIPIVIFLIFFSQEIVTLLYGDTYVKAPLYLSIYCIAFFLIGFGYLSLDSLFNGLSKTRITLTKNFIIFLTILILSPILTAFYGVLGLIGAILLARLFGTIYGNIIAKSILNMTFDLKSPLLIYAIGIIAILPIIFLKYVNFSPFIQIVVGVSLYFLNIFTLIPITNALSENEINSIKKIVKRIQLLNLLMRPFFWYIMLIFKIKKYFFSSINGD